MTPTEKEQLLDLFAKRGSWCNDCEARTGEGVMCSGTDDRAVRFSLIGALWHLFGQNGDERPLTLCIQLAAKIGSTKRSVLEWKARYAREQDRLRWRVSPDEYRWAAYRQLVNWEDMETREPRDIRKLIKRAAG